MPKLTIAAGATAPIPNRQFNNIPATRKGLVLSLISGDAYFGWTDTVSASGDTDAGIPLTVGFPISMSGEHYDFSSAVNIFSVGGAVLNYQECNK